MASSIQVLLVLNPKASGPLRFRAYGSKLLDELGLSLLRLDAANKGEWHNITRPAALAARAASRLPAQVAAQRPSDVTKGPGAAPSASRAAGAEVRVGLQRRQHVNLSSESEET